MSNNLNGHPFAVNFRKLQNYNLSLFSLDEVVFYEYLMILGQSFGYRDFYHSTAKISADLGLKRTRIEAIIKKLEYYGIISVEVRGFPKVKYFTINAEFILDNLGMIYQFAENSKLYAEINKLYVEICKQFVETCKEEKLRKETLNKKLKKETKDMIGGEAAANVFSFSLEDSRDFIDLLESKFNDRRLRANSKKYPPVTLGHKNSKTFNVMLSAMRQLGKQVIIDAWLVYCDNMINGSITPTQILPYFLSKKDGEFDVIGTMADHHNLYYVYTGKG